MVLQHADHGLGVTGDAAELTRGAPGRILVADIMLQRGEVHRARDSVSAIRAA
ncbi:MAG: hypothetical protein H6876_07180 [Hyphomicrobiaceae bacterium]|nr:hypothetical protein [Hyphomicrobiaceae bacterium]